MIVGAALLAWAPAAANAQYPLSPSPATIDFTGFTGAGFDPAPAAGQLDSDEWIVRGVSDGDMAYGDSENAGDYARGISTGDEATGGVYAWDTGMTVALGANITGSDFTPGEFVLRVENTTGQSVTSFEISYRIWSRNNGNRTNSLGFSWSLDDSAYTGVASLDFATVAGSDGGAGWESTDRAETLSGFTLDADEVMYLRWQFAGGAGSGSHDEIGIDDIGFTVFDVCGNDIEEAGEDCDDGNTSNTDACVDGCVDAACGDGFVQAGVEGCDDGNMTNTDGCPDGAGGTCQDAQCGDGFVEAGVEDCDDMNGDDTDACVSGCVDASCGDGFVQNGVEICDDGNMDNTDACPDGDGGTCEDAVCGDGFVEAGAEECDDANRDDDDECANNCTANGDTTTSTTTGDSESDDTTTDDSSDTTAGVDDTGSTTCSDSCGTSTGTPGSSSSDDATSTTSGTPPVTSSSTDPSAGGTSGGDTDTGFEGEDAPGCGCRSTGGGAPAALGLLMLAAGIVRRRRD